MVRGVPSGQLFATCRPAPAFVPAANAAAAGAAHDPAAHSTGPRAAEECTLGCKWTRVVHINYTIIMPEYSKAEGQIWRGMGDIYIIND